MTSQEVLTNELDLWVKSVQATLLKLSDSLPITPVLGPEFNSASFEPTWLIYHRLRSSLFKGQESDASAHSSAIEKMLEEDAALKLDLKTVKPQVRRTVYQARLLCNEMSRDLSFDVSLVDFSSGETFVSASGKTSLYQKLRDLKHWCLTADAEDLVLKVLYYNRGLKKVAMSHIRRRASRRFLRTCYKTVVNTTHLGFEVFSLCCRKFLFTYVEGSRVETVPKNSTSRRTINVEPWLNLLCQRIIGLSIRKRLALYGNDLEYGQTDHQILISDPRLATIDLKSASNSNALHGCQFMLSSSLFNRVSAVRSPYVLYEDSYYPLNMVSAMGCGFTFEIMTLILLSVARTMDPKARVYGDDIIINNRHASHFCECINALGYQINISKTFINSSFRESCGSFWHDRVGYVKAYEIPLPQTIEDAIAATNKLFLLSESCWLIASAHAEALLNAPRCIRGPYLPSKEMDSLAGWVWDKEYECSFADGLDKTVFKNLNSVMNDWGYTSFLIWQGIVLVPELASLTSPVVKKGNIEKIQYYVNAGRRSDDVIRNSNSWSTCLFVSFGNEPFFIRYKDILTLTG